MMKHNFTRTSYQTSLLAGVLLVSTTSLAHAADSRYTDSSFTSSLKVLSVANATTGQPVIGFTVTARIDQTSCIPEANGKLCLADIISTHDKYGERRFSEFVSLPVYTNDSDTSTNVTMNVNVPAPITYGEVDWKVQLCVQGC